MNAERLLAHFERVADAPDAVARLRRFILDLAVRGKLVPQDANDEPAHQLLERIKSERSRLIGEAKRESEGRRLQIRTDAPFDSPLGWVWSTLGEIASKTGSGSTPRGGRQVYVDSGVPFLRSQNVYNDGLRLQDVAYINVKTHTAMEGTLVHPGDLLLNITGASIGRCCIVPTSLVEANVSQHVAIIRLAIAETVPFLHKLILSPYFQSFVIAEQTGAGRGGLPKRRMDRLPVAVPPLAEQHRIVSRVDELMALCDRLQQAGTEREAKRERLTMACVARLNAPDPDPVTFANYARFALNVLPTLTARRDQIQQLRQTVLNLAVRGKLTSQDSNYETAAQLLERVLVQRREEWIVKQVAKSKKDGQTQQDWRGKYPVPPHEIGLFDIPNSWTWASTAEVCERVENGNTPPATRMSEGVGEIPFIKVYNLTKNGTLNFTIKPTFVERETHEKLLARSKVRPGDVLMNIVGPPLGKVSVVPDDYPEWNTNQAVVLFRPSTGILARYLATSLLADCVLFWITRTAQATVGQSNITVSSSRALPIPLPPLVEQRRILAKVDELMAVCDRLEASLANAATTRSRLLEALLADALAPVAREISLTD